MGAKARWFFPTFSRVSHVTGTLPVKAASIVITGLEKVNTVSTYKIHYAMFLD
jgi:hypothetical protein